MTAVVASLRSMWRRMFIFPRRTDGGWRWFALYWSWSLAGVLPGAVIAAYVIGRQHIAAQAQQTVIAVASAFGGALVIQVLMSAWLVLLDHALAAPYRRPVAPIVDEGSKTAAFVVTFAVPFLIAGVAVYLYFTHLSAAADAGTRGAGGAILLKTLVSLVYTVVVPAATDSATGVVKEKALHWLRGDKMKPRGA